MKVILFGTFAGMVFSKAYGYSFSDASKAAAPPPASLSDNGMTADEEDRIFGGRNAKVDKYPYMVGLRANGSADVSYCGGALVAPQYVATAAHCLGGWTDPYVSLGTQQSWGRGSRKAEQIRVVEVFRHPLYNSTWYTHDVAMLKLETPARHQPVKLCATDGSDNKPGTMATVLGWGMVNNETFSETLQQVDVEIIPDEVCANYTISTEIIMCAGVGDGKDSCGGDSGGPLIANGVLVGLVNAGPGEFCGEAPGLYTRVAQVLDFIHDILNGGSSGNVTYMLTAGAGSVALAA